MWRSGQWRHAPSNDNICLSERNVIFFFHRLRNWQLGGRKMEIDSITCGQIDVVQRRYEDGQVGRTAPAVIQSTANVFPRWQCGCVFCQENERANSDRMSLKCVWMKKIELDGNFVELKVVYSKVFWVQRDVSLAHQLAPRGRQEMALVTLPSDASGPNIQVVEFFKSFLLMANWMTWGRI